MTPKIQEKIVQLKHPLVFMFYQTLLCTFPTSLDVFFLLLFYVLYITSVFVTGDFMKKVPQLPVCTRDRQIVSIERVYAPSTFYMKSSVDKYRVSNVVSSLDRQIYLDSRVKPNYAFSNLSLSVYRQIHRQIDRQIDRQINTQIHRQINRQIDKQSPIKQNGI